MSGTTFTRKDWSEIWRGLTDNVLEFNEDMLDTILMSYEEGLTILRAFNDCIEPCEKEVYLDERKTQILFALLDALARQYSDVVLDAIADPDMTECFGWAAYMDEVEDAMCAFRAISIAVNNRSVYQHCYEHHNEAMQNNAEVERRKKELKTQGERREEE